MEDLVKDVDRLVSCLATKVYHHIRGSVQLELFSLYAYLTTFDRLAHAFKESTLNILLTELLLWLLDERVPIMDDGSQLLKALNVLMLKDNAERTSSFVALINLLWPLDPSIWPLLAFGETFAARSQKFCDLVVKCLINLTKDIEPDQLIIARAGLDDRPLHMVKTVLHELAKLRGTAIKGHLSMVPIDLEPQPYIDLNLRKDFTLAAARMLAPSGSIGQTHWGDSVYNGPSPATHSADAQLKYRESLLRFSRKSVTSRHAPLACMTFTGSYSCTLRVLYFRSYRMRVGPDIYKRWISTDGEKYSSWKDTFECANVDGDSCCHKSLLTKACTYVPCPFEAAAQCDETHELTNNSLFVEVDDATTRYMHLQATAAAGNTEGDGGGNVEVMMMPTNVLPLDEKALSGLQARMERLKSSAVSPM
ncbi:hypothetical protein AMTR_s00221p00021540 [Amborella trichopoda]|uniref:Uncharacterized protein n=1 Tax=Amborella trichopoda TaxID=13333 RepID=W1NTA3_AMBTC|nr:hypothetical protein AMTR_s00221p00021540 [Amborella trichopoda]